MRKRLIRNFIIYTFSCVLIGFALGIVIGQMTVEVEAVTESIPVSEPCVTNQPIVTAESIIIDEPEIIIPETNIVSLGVCKISAYCKENYPHICNNGDSSTTATGTTPTAGRTVAVDPKVIPYGSEVIINGHTYIAEDCGGAIKGNRIDILFETHQEAIAFGIRYAEVEYCKPS